MNRADLYDHAGLMTAGAGRLLSTHVGDDLAWAGFQEGAYAPGDVESRSEHPVYGPSLQLVGLGVLVLAVLYMDHRLKVPFKLG